MFFEYHLRSPEEEYAYWTAGYQQLFPESYEVKKHIDRSTRGGATLRGPARARTSFPQPFSPEGRSSNRPSAQRASGKSVASVAKITEEGL